MSVGNSIRHEIKMEVAEMRMSQWMFGGVTRLNRIINEYIRGSLGVGKIMK